MIYAQVVVNQKTAKIDLFSYQVTATQLLKIKAGVMVEVPFRNQLVEGVVFNLTKHTAVAKVKPIKRLLSQEPIATANQFKLATWLAKFYGVSLGEALFTIIPKLSRRLL